MAADLTTQMLERIPLNFITFCLVSGMMILFFTPFRFLAPVWLINPFVGLPTDALASSTLIILVSFFFGVLVYLVRGLIMGNNGLNWCVRDHSCFRHNQKTQERKGKTERKLTEKQKNEPQFVKWITDFKMNSYTELLMIQEAVADGLLCGSEVVLILNCISGLFLVILQPALWIEVALWLFVLPLSIGLAAYLFSNYYLRPYLEESWNRLWNQWEQNKNMKQAEKT